MYTGIIVRRKQDSLQDGNLSLMKYIFCILLMCFCLSCEDPESINLKNENADNAENISLDPFSMTSESWAEHLKYYFSHDILIKSWGFDDIYIAIYRNENWLDICWVINQPFGRQGKMLWIAITDELGNSIYDLALLDSEIEKDPSLGTKCVFYDNRIFLAIDRSPIQRAFIGKKVNVFVKTMEMGEKTNLGTNLLEGTQLINENIVLH